jgi:excisionase family DNA binding protein
MNLSIIQKEDLEDLVQTSVEKTLRSFFNQRAKENSQPQTLTIRETAKFLSVTETTVRNYIQRGLIKADKIGGRIFISREKLLESLKEVKSFKYLRDD